LNKKQGTEKEHAAERAGCCMCTREGGRDKELFSMGTFSKQTGKAEGLTTGGYKPLPEIGQIVATNLIS
jgi:hypothetical protein